MKIGILGTRGIPNYYGGFEQFAQFLSVGLVKKGYEVYVYCSDLHPYQKDEWKGVYLIHCRDLENKIGTAGQFIYDLNCIIDSRKRSFDVLLQLGYTSSSIWSKLLPQKTKIVTNMDGLEWKRSKFSSKVQYFLKKAEKWAVFSSDELISDSIGIQDYIKKKYSKTSTYIPYGADIFTQPNERVLEKWNLNKHEYYILVARMEPENNIDMILNGFEQSKTDSPFIVIGKLNTPFAGKLKEKYKLNKNIFFVGGVYDQDELSSLRYYSKIYFHGHSVGGTNPSLLEAMGCSAYIAAHDNIFNRSILEDDALYFSSPKEVATIIDQFEIKNLRPIFIKNNLEKIKQEFSWESIVRKYEALMIKK